MENDEESIRSAFESNAFSDKQLRFLRRETQQKYESGEISLSDGIALFEKYKHGSLFQISAGEAESNRTKRALNLKRWDGFSRRVRNEYAGFPYRYSHAMLIAAAKKKASWKVANTVTCFSDWVYSLYLQKKDPRDLALGKLIEQEREEAFQKIPEPTDSNWERVYIGINTIAPVSAKQISILTVDDKPIWGKPDYVFRHKRTGDVVVVEVKGSNRVIPSDGWPNLRAQLWAYAHIDDYLDAPRILMVGEIWGHFAGFPQYRKTLRWEYGRGDFDKQNGELFSRPCKTPASRADASVQA